ncbi:MAG: winged helix-turn-helix domain-containing protein [Vicinamibacterales bacterium]
MSANVLRFDVFELDVRARELRHGGKRIRLQDQPCEILQMLLERGGDIVTRDELRERLWPQGTFVDFEHSLNAAIKRLRAALGDEADNPRFVETVPRRGYRLAGAAKISVAHAAAAATVPEHVSCDDRIRLAVLPFTNLGAPDQEFFCDGLTEEMALQIGRLGRKKIAVIARWSSMAFKGTTRRASEIGAALRAEYLLEGTVRREGDRVRITAALVEAAGEAHLWTDTYDERIDAQQLGLQVSVAERIARSLHVELVCDDAPAVQPDSKSPAYQAYLKGRYYWNQLADTGLRDAIAYFDEAVVLEPGFAAAWASLAVAHVASAEYYRERAVVALEGARRGAVHALALDSTLPTAHIAMGDVHRILDWDWVRAEQAYARALSFNPSSESARRRRCVLLAALGRADEAELEARRVTELDPLCLVVGSATAWSSYLSGEYVMAVSRSRGVLELDPRFQPARRVHSASLLALGRTDEAVEVLMEDAESGEPPLVTLLWLAHALGAAGRGSDAARVLAGVLQPGRHPFVPGYHAALAHVGVGNVDAALTALEVASEQRDPALVNLTADARLRPLAHERRFLALLARVNRPTAELGRGSTAFA